MRKNFFIWYAVVLMVICFSIQTILSMQSLSKMNKSNNESYAKVMAGSIYNSINEKMLEPILIGRTMANDELLIGMIETDNYDESQKLDIFTAYLQNIVDRQKYDTAFLVYEPSKVYVSDKGFNKIVDPINDEHDIWYSSFLDLNKEYVLNVDTDQTTGDEWTMFVNCLIHNENGDKLGVCGVGVVMSELSRSILDMQKKYGVHISLVDENGEVIIDADNINFTNAMLDTVSVSRDEDTYRYDSNNQGYSISRYMNSIGLYLVIEKTDTDISKSYLELIIKNVIVMVLLFIITVCCVLLMIKKEIIEVSSKARTNGLSSVASLYLSMHEIDLEKNKSTRIKSTEYIDRFVKNELGNASNEMIAVMTANVDEDYREGLLSFVDLKTLKDRLKGQRTIVHEFMGKNVGWCRARFIVEGDDLENIKRVVFLVRIIDNEKKKEEKLVKDSTVDELTQCFNRKAYEDDIKVYNENQVENNLIYVSMDVNGLKVINDTMGHAAGDELIKGAAECMKLCLGSYGKVYRTGGDEFIAIIFASEDRLKNIKLDMENTMYNWHGKFVNSLTVSCGYVCWKEYPQLDITDLAKVADNRMYEAKAMHYQKKGVDRRGQQAAYNAICASYVKILKVNLTEDIFNSIQVIEDERIEEKGYSEKISSWFHDFAMSGQVHEDDQKLFLTHTSLDYLRKYFLEGHPVFSLHYRRNIDGLFKKVLMEMVPANDYAEDKQIVYLYVKNIE